MRKQLKPRTLQPLVGGGRFDARLQLSLRSAEQKSRWRCNGDEPAHAAGLPIRAA